MSSSLLHALPCGTCHACLTCTHLPSAWTGLYDFDSMSTRRCRSGTQLRARKAQNLSRGAASVFAGDRTRSDGEACSRWEKDSE